MTVRGDVTIDWSVSPRIITVLAPSTTITIQDLHDTAVSIEGRWDAMDNARIVSTAGKEFLAVGKSVGLTMTLLDAKLAFEARPGPAFVQCEVDGGNLVAVDTDGVTPIDPIQTTAYTQVIRTSDTSAVLLDADEMASRILELWILQGLQTGSPLTVTDAQRAADTIVQTVSDNGTTTTVTRTS